MTRFSEYALIEQSAINLPGSMGWEKLIQCGGIVGDNHMMFDILKGLVLAQDSGFNNI